MKTISYCLLNLFEGRNIFRGKKKDNWKALYSSFCALGHWFFRRCNVLHGEIVLWTFIHISDLVPTAHIANLPHSEIQHALWYFCLTSIHFGKKMFHTLRESRSYRPLSGFPAITWYLCREASDRHPCSKSGDTQIPATSLRIHVSRAWLPAVFSYLCGDKEMWTLYSADAP